MTTLATTTTLQNLVLRYYFQNHFTALFLGKPVRAKDAAAVLGFLGSEKAAAHGFIQQQEAAGQRLLASPLASIVAVKNAMEQHLQNQKMQSLGRRALLTILAHPDVLQAAHRRDLAVFQDGSIATTESSLLRDMGYEVLSGCHRTVVRGMKSFEEHSGREPATDPDDVIVTSLLYATFYHDMDCLSEMVEEGRISYILGLFTQLAGSGLPQPQPDNAFAIAADAMLSTLMKALLDQEHKRGMIVWNKILYQDFEANSLFKRMRALGCLPAVYDYMLSHLEERSEDGGVPELCMEFFAWMGDQFCPWVNDENDTKYLADLVLEKTLDLMLNYNDTSKQFFFHAVEMLSCLVSYSDEQHYGGYAFTDDQKVRMIAATKKAEKQFPVYPWDSDSVDYIVNKLEGGHQN